MVDEGGGKLGKEGQARFGYTCIRGLVSTTTSSALVNSSAGFLGIWGREMGFSVLRISRLDFRIQVAYPWRIF